MDAFTQAYIECAEWTLDDESQAADGFSAAALADMRADCADFQQANADALDEYYACGRTMEQAGHDFWLTRNRHGAGFWDRGLPGDLGKRLTDMAHPYGSQDIYVGDDGSLYV
jgi:hypothetical protein